MKTILKTALAAGLASAVMAQNEDALRQQKIQERQATADTLKATLQRLQTFNFVYGQLISGPPVKGAPYSAEAVNESIQMLADGNRIVQRTSAMQYRDTEGRERREETSAMGVIFITDPVAGERYTLHPETRSAEKGPMASVFLKLPANGSDFVDKAKVVIAGGRGNGEPLTVVTRGRGAATPRDAKTEQLGNMFIEGVQAQGTRTTTTIPAGTIGNERPINIVDERWYSPDLQMTVMTKHSDPRSGETNFQLKNINRSSPPPNLFEIPSDYTVSAGGGRGGAKVLVEPRK